MSGKQENVEKKAAEKKESAPGAAGTGPKINWNDKNMQSSYANVCNVASTREEIALFFGLNQAWNAERQEVAIELSNRIILNPFAAKRLSLLLNNVLKTYEERYGSFGDTPTNPQH